MNKRGWAFLGVLVALALAAAYARRSDIPLIASYSIVGWLAFVFVGVLSEALALKFRVGRTVGVQSSVSYLPLFACAVTFPPLWAGLAGAAVAVVSDIAVRKLRGWIPVFNGALYLLGLLVATAAYTTLGGGTFGTSSVSIPAFFVLAATYFVFNLVVVSSFFAARQLESLHQILTHIAGPMGGNLFYDLLASPIALLAGWLYFSFGVYGIALVILPLLLVRYSYTYAIQLRKVNNDLMRVLVKAIETRDPYTSGHSMRVSALAKTIGTLLSLSKRQVAAVEQAAMLHDIGKIEAPYANIIRKPHELSESERALIRTHPTQGAEMLLALSAFKDDDLVGGVRHHHENFDGSGYPDGLRKSEIPLTARIIMVCDSLDAMLSDRPYRRALDAEHVRRELVRCSGSQFDPNIVQLVLQGGVVERAQELVRQQPPEAMMYPAPTLVDSGT